MESDCIPSTKMDAELELENNKLDDNFDVTDGEMTPRQIVIKACKYGDLEGVKKSFEDVTNVEEHKKIMDLLISLSGGYGHLEILKYLEGLGGNVRCNNENMFGSACRYNRLNVVTYLLDNGKADVSAQKYYGFCWACKNGHFDMVKLLVKHGVNIKVRNNIALNLAVQSEHYELTAYLLKNGIDPNGNENFPLNYITIKGMAAFFDLIVPYNPVFDFDEGIALCNCIRHNNMKMITTLLDKGIKANTLHNKPVIMAARSNHTELVKFLHGKGADITANRNICVFYAVSRGNLELLMYLHKNGADLSDNDNRALRTSVKDGAYQITNYLLNTGINIDKIYDELVRYCEEMEDDDTLHLLEESKSESATKETTK